jgi:hypothetical protein
MAVTCNAPTVRVTQLREYEIDLEDEFLLPLDGFEYGFIRKVRWQTVSQRYPDNRLETLPQQLLRRHEFEFHSDKWRKPDIDYLEEFVFQHKGPLLPFLFTAPDDGQTYEVRFKEDFTYALPSPEVRTGSIVLVEAGDLDNTQNNVLVYPDYVESESPIIIATNTLADGVVGEAYTQTFLVDQAEFGAIGTPPYHWSLATGPLPPGLTLDENTGVLSGTPTVPALYYFVIMCKDSAEPTDEQPYLGPVAQVIKGFTIRVWRAE